MIADLPKILFQREGIEVRRPLGMVLASRRASQKSGHRHIFFFCSLDILHSKDPTSLFGIFNKNLVNGFTLGWILRNKIQVIFVVNMSDVASNQKSSEDVLYLFRTLTSDAMKS